MDDGTKGKPDGCSGTGYAQPNCPVHAGRKSGDREQEAMVRKSLYQTIAAHQHEPVHFFRPSEGESEGNRPPEGDSHDVGSIEG